MNFYFAPMEGITLYPLRNIHKEMFGENITKYYTPFLTAVSTRHFKNREKLDALPEKNSSFDNYEDQIVPQIMSGNADNFIWAAKELKKLGYNEVNLNLGCPAPTVANRGKGAGLLKDTAYLEDMLSSIFEQLKDEDLKISLKTRLGFSYENEADSLMEVYSKFPVHELTIHARVREDFYKGDARISSFDRAVRIYRDNGGTADICYNGNIFTTEDYKRLFDEVKEIDQVSSVMIGRGLLENPALVREIEGGAPLYKEELKEYLTKLYEAYEDYIKEDRNVIFKLLEHWAFLQKKFDNCDKYLKAVRKARSRNEYMAAVRNLFANCDLV